MKRTVALAILAALLLTLCACSKVRQAEEAIDAIGAVTAESGAQIEAAEAAVEALNDKQRDKLPNLTVLEEAQTEYETVLEEQAETEACVQEAENAIDAIGSVTLVVARQPFPGPGLAIRIIGDVTPEKVAIVQDADAIWREEVDKLPMSQRPSQYFAALTNMRSVGVMGDERTYDYAIALRAVTTTDFMTAEVTILPTETITTAANRIVNEVKNINRVMFDYTTKPPATIEFE